MSKDTNLTYEEVRGWLLRLEETRPPDDAGGPLRSAETANPKYHDAAIAAVQDLLVTLPAS